MTRKRIVAVTAAGVMAVTLGLGARAGADKPQKFEVNHKGKTICVSENAVPAHVKHGDSTVFNPC